MKIIIHNTLAIIIVIIAYHASYAGEAQETVMTDGMSITVTNKTGNLTITAGKGYERSYTCEYE